MNQSNQKSNRAASERFLVRARAQHGERYDYSEARYVRAHEKVTIGCPEHGPFQQTPAKHMSGRGCPECARLARIAALQKRARVCADQFHERAQRVHPTLDLSSAVYTAAHERVTVHCPEHGEFSIRAYALLNGQGCAACHRERLARGGYRQLNTDEFLERAAQQHGARYNYEGVDYAHGKCPVEIRCPTHGSFMQRPNDHLSGHGCPRCAAVGPSAEEDLLFKRVREIVGPATVIERNVRNVIAPQELDIYIPSMRLALEFNGSYWHNDTRRAREYHQQKKLSCIQAGVDLIHVYDFLWRSRSEQILDLIRSRTGQVRRVFARRCCVARITREQADLFCEQNHIQGSAASSVQLGIFQDTQLVGCFTAGRPRFTQTARWEIIRICFARGVQVVGGAGRMLKHFTRRHCQPGDLVLSYAQLDWSNGGLYRALGFTHSHNTVPGYHWVELSTGAALPRYRTQKHRLERLLGDVFDPGQSESENMERAGWRRVYGSGSAVYTLTVK